MKLLGLSKERITGQGIVEKEIRLTPEAYVALDELAKARGWLGGVDEAATRMIYQSLDLIGKIETIDAETIVVENPRTGSRVEYNARKFVESGLDLNDIKVISNLFSE